MVGLVRDDGGRLAAGYAGYAGDGMDCVVRSLVIVLARGGHRGLYRKLFSEMRHFLICCGQTVDSDRFVQGLPAKVWRPMYRKYGLRPRCYRRGRTLTDLAGEFPRFAFETEGVRAPGHVSALVDGLVRDTMDVRIGRDGRERKIKLIWVHTWD